VTIRPRDRETEQRLTNVAGESIDLAAAAAKLNAFADSRCAPGGVRIGPCWDTEAAEELADTRNYMVWGIEDVLARAEAGDVEASRDYERRMRTLAALVRCYHELTTPAG
jgi:hypothetical protein